MTDKSICYSTTTAEGSSAEGLCWWILSHHYQTVFLSFLMVFSLSLSSYPCFAAEPELVKDINPGSLGSVPSVLTDVNGTLFFAARDATTGKELWKSDGTAAGTVMVNPGGNEADPQWLIFINKTLFFAAEDIDHGEELWKLEGPCGKFFVIPAGDGKGSVIFL